MGGVAGQAAKFLLAGRGSAVEVRLSFLRPRGRPRLGGRAQPGPRENSRPGHSAAAISLKLG